MDDRLTNRVSSGMRFRKLRIAWSVAWGIACLLLIVLWMRSYWYIDYMNTYTSSERSVSFSSRFGVIVAFAYVNSEPHAGSDIRFQSIAIARILSPLYNLEPDSIFAIERWPDYIRITLSHLL